MASPWAPASPAPCSARCMCSTRTTRRSGGSTAPWRLDPGGIRPHLGVHEPRHVRATRTTPIPAHVPLRLPDEGDGTARGRLRAERGGYHLAPRAGLPRRDDRDAHVQERPLPVAHGDDQREVARAARRPLLGALAPSHGADGPVITRALGRVAYEPTWRAMQAFSRARDPDTADQLW